MAIAGQTHKTKADDKGNWQVTLEPLTVGEPLKLVVESGKNRLRGEGHSRRRSVAVLGPIEYGVAVDAGDERGPGDFGRQPSADSVGRREGARQPDASGGFRRRMESLHAGIGERLFGGRLFLWPRIARSARCADRIDRRLMGRLGVRGVDSPRSNWKASRCTMRCSRSGTTTSRTSTRPSGRRDWAEWRKKADEARKEGKPAPPNRPRFDSPAAGNHRPANLYHGRLEPVMPYAIRGVDLVSGRVERRAGLPVSRHVPADDQVVARGLEAGRFPVLLGCSWPTSWPRSRSRATARGPSCAKRRR